MYYIAFSMFYSTFFMFVKVNHEDCSIFINFFVFVFSFFYFFNYTGQFRGVDKNACSNTASKV